jgi:hypothetical protein
MTDSMNTWYKLKDGTWGAKLRVVASEGECVMLTNKKGEERLRSSQMQAFGLAHQRSQHKQKSWSKSRFDIRLRPLRYGGTCAQKVGNH